MIIALEGADGVGKSTVYQKLIWKLRNIYGNNIAGYKFPDYSSPSGKVIEKYLHGEMQPDSEALSMLYALNKLSLRDKVFVDVVLDRWTLSNIIYQGWHDKKMKEKIAQIEYDLCGNTTPDLNIILSLDWKLRNDAIANRGNPDRNDVDVYKAVTIECAYREYVQNNENYARATYGNLLIECAENGVRFTPEQICDIIIEKIETLGLLT